MLHEVLAQLLDALGHRAGVAVHGRRLGEHRGQRIGIVSGQSGGVETSRALLDLQRTGERRLHRDLLVQQHSGDTGLKELLDALDARQAELKAKNEIEEKSKADTEAIASLVGQTLSATEAVRVADAYSKLIRFALGEPDQNVAITGRRGGPVAFSHIPADDTALQKELEAAITELARKHSTTGAVDPYDVLELPE